MTATLTPLLLWLLQLSDEEELPDAIWANRDCGLYQWARISHIHTLRDDATHINTSKHIPRASDDAFWLVQITWGIEEAIAFINKIWTIMLLLEDAIHILTSHALCVVGAGRLASTRVVR